jgi:D-sedoheptulose 7-phosphate isomerase
MDDRAYIDTYFEGIATITASISRTDVQTVIDCLYDLWRRGGTLYTAGNGGSASTATHLAADLTKITAIPGKPRFRAMSLVDNIPLVSALTNDEGWENIYTAQLQTFFRPGDAVLALSVHGGSGSDRAGQWSQNLVKALDFANRHGGASIGLSGFDGGAFREVARYNIVVPYETTPHVEAYHVVLHHLITFCLRDRILRTETAG